MNNPLFRAFRLAGPAGDGLHPYVNDNGAFIGMGTPLVDKDQSGQYRPRPMPELRKVFAIGYDDPLPLERRMRNLDAVARAFNKGDRALAAILLLHAEFPPLPDRFAAERMTKAHWLYKDFDPNQPRVPAGSPDGGRWTTEDGQGNFGEIAPQKTAGLSAHCAEEWLYARTECRRLLSTGQLGLPGWAPNFPRCLMGFVSAACGGNAT